MSGHEAVIRAMGGEFPGWQIEGSDDALGIDWQAGRPPAPDHGGIVATYADSLLVLRKLLEAAQDRDHRLAVRTLAARLGERGVTVRTYQANLIVTGPDERELIVICGRAVFRWAMGEEIGPVTGMDRAVQDVADAAKAGSS
ncbi:hypothetical protein AGRA3207_002420 [Actinomadura graeca]|uniref:Uncharacterized protein n=1 Tax=Actinomadura graeca TaxID=2750812 RepID=A0ABX8QSF0_9ACTN|nr:hypothetical protein [Actinomadura graeca]QXJ21558.1 hypothetical protein AGRA3207_002420 [Actinomadura graeca]